MINCWLVQFGFQWFSMGRVNLQPFGKSSPCVKQIESTTLDSSLLFASFFNWVA